VLEALGNIPTTAHLLGGAVIGDTPAHGVIDKDLHVFGYRNLLVCDGAAMPANPGVNPALTITALAEYAMSQIPMTAARMSASNLDTEPLRRQSPSGRHARNGQS
jgi:cholesterol oxidase